VELEDCYKLHVIQTCLLTLHYGQHVYYKSNEIKSTFIKILWHECQAAFTATSEVKREKSVQLGLLLVIHIKKFPDNKRN